MVRGSRKEGKRGWGRVRRLGRGMQVTSIEWKGRKGKEREAFRFRSVTRVQGLKRVT